MVKLDKNANTAVFWLMSPQEQEQHEQHVVPTQEPVVALLDVGQFFNFLPVCWHGGSGAVSKPSQTFDGLNCHILALRGPVAVTTFSIFFKNSTARLSVNLLCRGCTQPPLIGDNEMTQNNQSGL
jgi:hypothetical protein